MEYTVQKGDTLSQIAKKQGVNIGDISGYKSGNPNLIYPGEKLTIGGAAGQASLPALPSTTGESVDSFSLPELKNADPMTLLSASLKQIGSLAMREGKMSGMEEMFGFFGDREVKPEDLPGGTVAQMIGMVDRAMVDPVKDRLQTMSDMINVVVQARQELKDTSYKQMSLMMSQGMWNGFMNSDPAGAKELWRASGFSGEPYKIPEAPTLKDIKIGDRIPGFTLKESNDIYYSDTAPEWFIDKYDTQLAQELREEHGNNWFNEYKKIMKTVPGTSGRINAPEFMKLAQQAWTELRRDPTKGQVESTAIDMLAARARNLFSNNQNISKEDFILAVNNERELLAGQGWKMDVTSMNAIINSVFPTGTKIPDDQLEKVAKRLIEIKGGQEEAIQELKNIMLNSNGQFTMIDKDDKKVNVYLTVSQAEEIIRMISGSSGNATLTSPSQQILGGLVQPNTPFGLQINPLHWIYNRFKK